MTVPYTFADATGSLPLAELDVNFAYVSNSVATATGNITFSNTTMSTATANSDITIATSTGNAASNWVFGSNGNLTVPGKINSNNSIAITANTAGASNITLTANGATGNSTFIFDSSGNLVSPGNVYATGFIGSGQYLDNLLLNSTVGNIVLDIANTNSNVANTNSNVANTNFNVSNLFAGLSNTDANVANTNSNVANLTVSVANITASIGNLQSNSYSNVNTAAYLRVYGGNIYSNNINSFGNVGGQNIYASQDILAGGSLFVNGTDTIINATQITSNVNTLTLNHDVTSSNLADLDGSGLLLGNSLVSWIYDYPSNSWQTDVNIETYTGTGNIGSQYNPWASVFATNVIVNGTFSTTSVVANVANIGDLVVRNTASIVSLAVSSDANIVGDLRVNGNSTLINTTAISSNVSTLILDKDNSTGFLADGSGIQIGLPAIATLLYNYGTRSWQSNIDITPSTNALANLGNVNNQWFSVYSDNVNALDVNAGNVNVGNVYSESISGNIVYGNTINGIDTSVSGNVIANVVLAISVAGLVTTNAQPRITSLGNLVSLTVVGNITGDYIYGNGRFLTGMPELYGNSNVANYLPTYTGNIGADNITANFFIGNGSQLTNVAAVTANTVVDNAQPNITSVGNLTALTVAGNATANYVFANGAVFNNDISVTGNLYAGNVNANISGTSTDAINVTGAAQPNITSVGTLTSLSVSGNLAGNVITANAVSANLLTSTDLTAANGIVYANSTGTLLNSNLVVLDVANSAITFTADVNANLVNASIVSTTGNITGSYILGNGSQLTGMPELYGNANVAAYLTTYNGNITANVVSAIGNIQSNSYILGNGFYLTGMPELYGNANVANYLPLYTGNLENINSITATGNITANYYVGNGSQLTGMYGNSNVANYIPTYSGNIGDLVSTGNISAAGNVNTNILYVSGSAVIVGNANIQGTLTYNDITNLVTDNLVLGLGNNQTGLAVTGAGIVVGNTNEASFLYDQPTSSWTTNISLSVTGNVYGNLVGDGTNVANVVALTVSENAQPNITSLGSLTSLTVVGNTLSGNFFTDSRISAAGNIESAGNISADYFIGNGSLLSDIVANVSELVNGSYAVSLNSTGTVEYPTVDDQQQALSGSTTTVYGDPYTIDFPGGQSQTVWTATSGNVYGFKMTVRAQTGNTTIGVSNMEIADITCSWDGSTTTVANALTVANATYTVSNRVKSNPSAPEVQYDIKCNGNRELILWATTANTITGNVYFTHSVTEFNKTT